MGTNRILVKEDFDREMVSNFIKNGYEVHILSDKKFYRKEDVAKFSSMSLSDNVKFGSVRDLHKKYNYDIIFTGEDLVLNKLLAMGSVDKEYQVIESRLINSMEEAIEFENEPSKLKFAKITVLYRYILRPDAPPLKTESRDFCQSLMSHNALYTREEIDSLNNGMKGTVSDVFRYKGGWYNNPETGETEMSCRHTFIAEKVIME